MKNTEKAFHWIVNILECKGIQYKISGGFAARVYGVDRELADIDIEVKDEDVPRIIEEVKPYIIFGPVRYKDDNWDLELVTLEHENQKIDISGIGARIFNQEIKQWEECPGDLWSIEMKEVFGRIVPIESLDSLIAYKTKLAREVDLEDTKQLKKLFRMPSANKFAYRLFADLILLLHLVMVAIILFGWYFPSLYWLYLIILLVTLISEISLGYCILSKWEFDLRKKIAPNLNYDYSFLSYYAYKVAHINIPAKYIRYPAIVFLVVSLILF